jgi:predicted PurR-regulated permease PerM
MVLAGQDPHPKDQGAPVDVPDRLQRCAGWAWRVLVLAAFVLFVGAVALRLELVVVPLLTALLLTALLHPLNRLLMRAHLPRGLSSALTVLLAIAVLGGIGAYVVNRASSQYPALLTQLDVLVAKADHYLRTGPLHLNGGKPGTGLGQKLTTYLRERQGQLLSGAVTVGRTVVDALTGIVLTFFLTIFMLYDGPAIWAWITGLFPRRSRATVHAVGEEIWVTLTGYVTGTFTVALFQGALMGVTLAVIGVPLVAPLTVLVFIGGFIPLIGAVVFGGLAVLITLVSNGGTAAVVVLIVLIVANQLESHVLQPFIVGRHVRLHPMAIALTLTSGAVLAGLPGAIFAVPLVASLNAAGRVVTGEDVLPVVTDDDQVAGAVPAG